MGATFPTDEQWLKLLDFAANDREIRTGQFMGPQGKQRVTRKWTEISQTLNALNGAIKDGLQWKEAFKNLKSRANAAYNRRMQYLHGTGGGECPEEVDLGLSQVYTKCNDICGTIKATGNTSVLNPLQVQRNRQNQSGGDGHDSSRDSGFHNIHNSARDSGIHNIHNSSRDNSGLYNSRNSGNYNPSRSDDHHSSRDSGIHNMHNSSRDSGIHTSSRDNSGLYNSRNSGDYNTSRSDDHHSSRYSGIHNIHNSSRDSGIHNIHNSSLDSGIHNIHNSSRDSGIHNIHNSSRDSGIHNIHSSSRGNSGLCNSRNSGDYSLLRSDGHHSSRGGGTHNISRDSGGLYSAPSYIAGRNSPSSGYSTGQCSGNNALTDCPSPRSVNLSPPRGIGWESSTVSEEKTPTFLGRAKTGNTGKGSFLNHTPPKSAISPARKRLFSAKGVASLLPSVQELITLTDEDGTEAPRFELLMDTNQDVTAGSPRIEPAQPGASSSLQGDSSDVNSLVQALQVLTSAVRANTTALNNNRRALELATKL